MQLKPYEEIIGVLTDLRSSGNKTTLVFSCEKTIEIPVNEVPQTIIQSKGQRIGIIRVEDGYKTRTLTKEEP